MNEANRYLVIAFTPLTLAIFLGSLFLFEIYDHWTRTNWKIIVVIMFFCAAWYWYWMDKSDKAEEKEGE